MKVSTRTSTRTENTASQLSANCNTQTNKQGRPLFMRWLLLLLTFATVSVNAQTIINSSGTYTIPPGVTTIQVYLWGGGGAGAGNSTQQASAFVSTGGGGGGACVLTSIAVTPGDVYTVTIGAGGIGNASAAQPGGNGGTTTFTGPAGTFTAAGGLGAPAATNNVDGGVNAGGAGGTVGTGTGITVFTGANGSASNNGTSSTTGITGNGGGGAGSGGNAITPAATCGVTGFGGIGTFPGGNGGVAAACATSAANATSSPGLAPGGGGSGTKCWTSTVLTGGNGAAGRVVIVSAACASPVNQPTVLNLVGAATTAISGSFTAAAGSDSYLVVRYPTGSSPTNPVDGTIYSAGGSLGSGTVVASGSSTSFIATGLTISTTYDFYVYSMVSFCVGSGAPFYLTTAPLTGTVTTPLTTSASALGGLWSSPATWAAGFVPSTTEPITIPAGSIVTVDQLVTAGKITIGGILQWNGTSNAMVITGDLVINPGGSFLPYTTGGTGQSISIGGNFANDGYANLALASTGINFNVAGSTLSGTGVFQGDGTNGIIRSLFFTSLGANSITTSQNLITSSLALTAGSLNTNGKLRIDNTVQVYDMNYTRQVASVAVTAMGSAYSVAPVVFGAAIAPYPAAAGALALNSRYFSGNNVYLCTVAGTSNGTAPVTTGPGTFTTSGGTLLWIGTLGTLGTPYSVGSVTAGTQVFYGGNLYTCIVAGTPLATAPPIHLSGTALSGTATFLYVGTPATVTVNYDATTQTLRSLNLTSAGSGLTVVPTIAFSVGVLGGTGTGAAASVVFVQLVAGPASSLFQKSGGAATVSGGITINSDQGTGTVHPQASSGIGAISTSNGGVNYTVAPVVGFSGPTAVNLVTNTGTGGYAAAPTITVDNTNLVAGTNWTSTNFTITMNQGKIVSIYLSTLGSAVYSSPPNLTLSSALGGVTIGWPAGCWPTATANIGATRQITSFTVTNSGFGYVAAPTVGIGQTSGTPLGGTFTTLATTPTARVALYGLTLNFFTPATTPLVNTDDAAIPASRKLNNLSLNGNGNGLTLSSGGLTLFGTAPLTLVASSSAPGNVLDLGGANLNFTWNGYLGNAATFGATNTYIKNGSMSLTHKGGGLSSATVASQTLNFPFSGTFTYFLGNTPTSVTTGSSVQRMTVTQTAAPSGPGSPIGARAFRVQTDAGSLLGNNPTVTMNYNNDDALAVTNSATGLFVAQAPALTGTWVLRSNSSGSGAIGTTGSRTTATATNGPIVPTTDDYFAWAYPAPTFTNASIPVATCPASSHLVSVDISTPTGTITGVTLNYNNGAVGSASMSLSGVNTYSATIPAASPTNATVTWTVTATNSIGVPSVFTGSVYKDDYLNGLTLSATATPNIICFGSTTSLNATLNTPAAPSYTAPPTPTSPANLVDLGNITITQGATTILNNTSTEASLNGTIGTATGTAGGYSNFTAFGPYILKAGQSYDYSISSIINPSGSTHGMGIFIDYNRNGVFTDPGEQVYVTPVLTSIVSHAETGTFTVPANASNGLCRMRIVANLGAITGPTVAPTWGEYEEYTINLVATGDLTYTWNDGTSDVGTGLPFVASPASSVNYTVTASNVAGCTLTSAAIPVSVLAVPPTPTASAPSSQCGYRVPVVFAVGGSPGTYNWYLTPTGGTPLTGEHNGALSAYAISTTTHFWVAITNGVCDGPRVELIANVTSPDAVTAFADGQASLTSCANTAINLTSTQTGSSNTYVFTWTAVPATGSGMPSQLTGANQIITPTAAGTYTYTLSADDNSNPSDPCRAVSSVTVTVNPQPVVSSVTATPGTVCAGFPVTLNGTSIQPGPPTVQIGSGTGSNANNTAIGAFYGTWFGNGHAQILIKASELSAAGFLPGNLTALSIDISALAADVPDQTLNGFTIKLGSVSAATTAITTFQAPTFTTVWGPTTYTPVLGTNTHPFISGYAWDGVSNIIVDYCFTNGIVGNGSAVNTITATSFGSFVNANADNSQPTMCANTTVSNTSSNRPNIKFTGLTGVNVTNTLNWTWTSVPVGPVLTGSTVTANPTLPSVYTATATIPATGCFSTGTVSVNVNPLPDAPGANDESQCGVGIPDCSVTSNNASPVFHWYLVPTGGAFLPGEFGSTLTAYSINTTKTFYVAEVSALGCESPRTAVTQTVLTPDPIFAAANGITGTTSFCIGGTLNLTASETGGNNVYAYTWTASPATAGSGLPSAQTGDDITITPTVAGTYVYTLSAFDGNTDCSNTTTVTVTVNPLPVIDSVSVSPAAVCAGQPATLNVYSPVVANGPQTPPTGYCTTNLYSSGCSAFGDYLANVTFAGINRTSACDAPGAGGSAAYSSYNSPIPTLIAGNSYPISLEMTPADTEGATVWIDYNRNGIFEASEVAFAPAFQDVVSAIYTGTVNIPANATAGQTMMRVRINFDEAPAAANACVATASWGETEDYVVNVQGVVTQNPALTYVWNPGAISGSTVTVSPSSTQSYTAKVTNPLTGCFSTSDPVTVNVNPLPPTPTATPSTQCGYGVPTASAVGTGGTLRWYDAATGGTLLQTGGNTYTSPISSSTTFWVGEFNGTCESIRVAVTVTVTTPPSLVITPASSTTICVGQSVSLNASSGSDPSYVNFTWTPATGLSATTGAVVSASPTTTTTYTVVANDGIPVTGCSNTATITINVNPLPFISSVSATPSTVCSTQSSTLKALSVNAASGFTDIGVQTTTIGGNDGNPYRSGNGTGNQIHTQLLVTASDLTAAGLVQGNVTSLGFTTTGIGGTVSDFTIRMGATAVGSLSSTFETSSMTTVFTQASFTTVLGLNTHVFSTPFVWNGTSNIVIDICQTNAITGTNTVTAYTPAYASNTHLAGSTTSCTAVTGNLVVTKPIMTFGGEVGTDQTANYNWVWNTVPPTSPVSGSTVSVVAGTTKTYVATATNPATGCSSTSAPVTITVLSPSVTGTASPSVSCAGSPVTLNGVATGSPAASWKWYDITAPLVTLSTAQSFVVNPTSTTTYAVVLTDACGVESAPFNVTVTVNPLPTASIAEATPITLCDPLTQVLTAVTTTANPTYQWTLNGTNINLATGSTYTVSGVGTGTYRVVVTETSTGCSATSAGVVVTINPSPSGVTAVASPNPLCFGFASTLTASSNTPPAVAMSQNWESGMGGWTAVNNTTGGTSPAATAWTIRPNPYTSTNSTPITFTNAGGGSSMILSNPDLGGSGTVSDNILTSPTFSTMNYLTLNLTFRHFYRFLTATETFVEVSTNGTTWTNLKSYTATQGTFVTPQATFASETINMDPYIGNPNVQIRFRYQDGWSWHWALDDIAVGGTFAGVNYSWSASPTLGSGMPSPVPGSPVSVTPTVAGSYVYTVIATNSFGCSTPASTTLVVTPLPVLTIDPVTSPVCFDAGPQTLSATPAGGTFSGPGVSGNTFTASVAGAGTHTITYSYTDPGTGCSNTATTSILVNPLPVAPSITIVNNVNGTSTITATGYTGTLTWSNGGSDNPHIVNAAGPYTVTQTDANGCTSLPSNIVTAGPSITADPALGGMDITDLADVSQNANTLVHAQVYKLYLPVYNFEQDFAVPNGATTIKVDLGSKLVLNPSFNLATAPLSTYFSWSHAVVLGHDIITGSQIAALPGDFDNMAVFEVVSSGSCTSAITATFIVDNHASVIALNDLVPNNNLSKLQYGLPTTVSAVKTNVVCNGAADGTITVTASEGTVVTVNGNPYSPSTLYGPGTYTIVATATNDVPPGTPCTATTSVTITEPTLLVASIFAQTNITGCFGDHTGAAAASATGGTPGYTYSWNTTPVQTTQIATNLAAGNYTVTITDANGCIKTATVTITEPAQVTIGINVQTNVDCFGNTTGSATVSAAGGTPGYTYSWSTSPVQTGPSATNLAAGTYTVTATDTHGCTGSTTVTITEPTELLASTTVTNVSCFGANDGTATAVASGGTAPYSYSWNTIPVQTDIAATNLAPGTYTLTVTDAHGCIKTATATITEPVVLSIALNGSTNNSCHGGSTGTISTTAAGGTTAYTYTIAGPTVNNTGQTSGIFNGLSAGSYTVTVTDAHGCTASTGTIIIDQPLGLLPDVSLGSDYTANFFASNGTSNTIVYNVAEVGGNPAVGDTIRLTKVAGYTFAFNASASTVTIGSTSYTLDNSRWKVDISNPAFVSLIFDPLHNSSPGMINCGEVVYISINVTRNTPNLSTFTLSSRLRRANSESNLANNLNSIVFTAE